MWDSLTPREEFINTIRRLLKRFKREARRMDMINRVLWKMCFITHEEYRRRREVLFSTYQFMSWFVYLFAMLLWEQNDN